MSNLALQNQVEYTMTILSGPDKGEVFKLMSTSISIGRSSTNDIVLAKDHKCSRQHAIIHISSTGIIIKSLNQNNLISVDGKEAEILPISHDSKIIIGTTKILFQISMLIKEESASNVPSVLGGGIFGGNAAGNIKDLGHVRAQQMPTQQKINFSNVKGGKNNLRWVLIIAIIGILIFALTDETILNKTAKGIRTEQDVDNDIETLNKLREAEQKTKRESGMNSDEFNQAQAHFIVGFRDFKKGKYERAISSFQACNTIFPNHDLCKTYKGLAQKKFQELVQFHMISGNKFTETGQYSACVTSFKNIMYMVKDRSSKVYLEADAKRKFCESRLRGRF